MPHDPHELRLRAAWPPDDPRRAAAGRRWLDALEALADAVTALLPELSQLHRFASRPNASVLTVGWSVPGALRSESVQLGLDLVAELPGALRIRWGLGAGAAERPGRRRELEHEAKQRRRHGESLLFRLASLRAEGAELRRGLRDEAALSEDEWIHTPSGVVVFHEPWRGDAGVLEARRVADRAVRLLGLGLSVEAITLRDEGTIVRDANDLLEGLRALRWDERAAGEGTPPSGMFPTGRDYLYDPVTGWFASERSVSRAPVCAAHHRLSLELGTAHTTERAPDAAVPGLTSRLARWLIVRGVADGAHEAAAATVRIPGGAGGASVDTPALERLLARILDDPSGDTAVAVAALLEGAPWTRADPLDPVVVATKLPARVGARVARGVSRLVEQGVLARDPTGGLHGVEVCLRHAVVRPVLWRAVERALGGLDVVPAGSSAWRELALSRAWELGGGVTRASTLETVALRMVRYAQSEGAVFETDLVRASLLGLRVKPFALFTGAPGTGKTRMATTLARYFTASSATASEQVAMIPVRPDWLDSRGLLGYLNVLAGRGVYEDTAALRVILHAGRHPDAAHFLVLDEMNLARAEHYLAEILSAMESGAPIPLHGRAEGVASMDGTRTVPAQVVLPPNLFVIGTVNLDETTHALSPKVLDRAWCWEFPPAAPSRLLRAWMEERRPSPPAGPEEVAALLGLGREEDATRALVLAMGRDGVGARIDALFAAMAEHGRAFGFRVASEMLRFVHLCEREGIEVPPSWALDHAVVGKLLPRMSGTRQDLAALVDAMIAVCGEREFTETERTARRGVGESIEPWRDRALPETLKRLHALRARLEREVYVSFSR